MTGAGTGMGRLAAVLFLSSLVCLPGVLSQCSKQDYQYCVKLADPLLKDPHLIYPDNPRDIEHVCRTWSFFVDCVKQYTDRCFTEIKRQEFNRAVENPVNSIHKLCSMPDYRNDYMKHAPCMKMTLTQDSHCGRHYRHLVAQVSGEAPRASICCSHHLFRECVLDHTRNSCEADAAPFSAQMLDKALSFLKNQCNNYVPNRVDCPGSDFYQTGRTELSTLEAGEVPPSPTQAGAPHTPGMFTPPGLTPSNVPPGNVPGSHMTGSHMPGGHMPGGHMPGGHMPGGHMPGGHMGGGTTVREGATSVTVQMTPPKTSPQPTWMSPSTDSRGVGTSNTPDWRQQQESTASSGAVSSAGGGGGWLPGNNGRGRSTPEPSLDPMLPSSPSSSSVSDATSRVSYGRGITWPSTERDDPPSSPMRPPQSTGWFPSSRPMDTMMKENAIDEPNQLGFGSQDNSGTSLSVLQSVFLLAASLLVQTLLSR